MTAHRFWSEIWFKSKEKIVLFPIFVFYFHSFHLVLFWSRNSALSIAKFFFRSINLSFKLSLNEFVGQYFILCLYIGNFGQP